MSNELPTRGFLTLGRIQGAALRVHFTTPLGAWFFAGFHFVAPIWLAFLALVLVHEPGHALVVWRSGAQVDRLDVYPYGGVCVWRGEVSPIQRACVAFGGVWAQLAAFRRARLRSKVDALDAKLKVVSAEPTAPEQAKDCSPCDKRWLN